MSVSTQSWEARTLKSLEAFEQGLGKVHSPQGVRNLTDRSSISSPCFLQSQMRHPPCPTNVKSPPGREAKKGFSQPHLQMSVNTLHTDLRMVGRGYQDSALGRARPVLPGWTPPPPQPVKTPRGSPSLLSWPSTRRVSRQHQQTKS